MTAEIIIAIALLCNAEVQTRMPSTCQREYIHCIARKTLRQLAKDPQSKIDEAQLLALCVMDDQ